MNPLKPWLSRWAILCLLAVALAYIEAAKASGKIWGGSKKGWRYSITDEQVATIKRLKSEGEKIARIARATGVSRGSVYRVLGD